MGKDSHEENEDVDTPSQAWWDEASKFPADGYGDEHSWNYWRKTGVAVDLQSLMEKDDYLESLIVDRLEMEVGVLGSL